MTQAPPPSYGTEWTQRSREIRLGYTAGKDADLAVVVILHALTVAVSSRRKALPRDLGLWNKDQDSTFFGTPPGSSPEERKQNANFLAVRILFIPTLR